MLQRYSRRQTGQKKETNQSNKHRCFVQIQFRKLFWRKHNCWGEFALWERNFEKEQKKKDIEEANN